MTFKVLTYNNISPAGLNQFPCEHYDVAANISNPDAVLLRSFDLHGVPIPETLKAVGRAGTGVNNIPVAEYSKLGIPVFNAPGANANAVAELVIAGMLLVARNIPAALNFIRTLEGDDDSLNTQVEHGKKGFAGFELAGKTLGVVGLGAIGVKVSNAATALGLTVIGFDPQMTVESAWKLSSSAVKAASLDDLLSRSDFITVHVPLNEHTRGLINSQRIERIKKQATVLNFSRAAVVDEAAVVNALDNGKLHAYVSDFPSNMLLRHPRSIELPHLGASTAEAEDNCAAMVAEQVRDFLENGNIRYSVNFPDVSLPRTDGVRVAIANENVPNMVSQITAALAENNLNIVDMLNKSRGSNAFTLIDVDAPIPAKTISQLQAIHGVLSVRVI
jgi:D-3-phosphoglycerate dehydrogenase / 2-oxoglutarate reductase